MNIYRSFEEVYDVPKFVNSLDGVVRVAKKQPAKLSTKNLAVVKVPNRVTEDYIAEHVEPVYKKKGNIRLATYFPSVNMKKTDKKSNSNSVACLAMFGTLELQYEIREVVDSMVQRLKTLSRKSDGQFVAVDLRVDILQQKGCQGDGEAGAKSCHSAQEVALFLRKIGFNKDTTVYLTESKWDSSLDALKDIFPKTYTKVRDLLGSALNFLPFIFYLHSFMSLELMTMIRIIKMLENPLAKLSSLPIINHFLVFKFARTQIILVGLLILKFSLPVETIAGWNNTCR